MEFSYKQHPNSNVFNKPHLLTQIINKVIMAELSIARNKKETPKVDLTAMVDLAFLLITFFMLTTSLSKPVAMDIVKPDESVLNTFTDMPASRTMTILLGKHNKVAWYMGEADKSMPYVEDSKKMRQTIISNQRTLTSKSITGQDKSLIVIIKPTSGATYKNFVDIMDDLNIANIKAAPAVDDDHITIREKDFMLQHNL
jgi:biopolymer transport protein ExbD